MKTDSLQAYRNRKAAAYMRGFDAYLINGESATNPYSRADFRTWWTKGRNHCKENKRPLFA